MRLRVLVIPDKFKGTLSAGAAAEAIARGWRKARPLDAVEVLPMCDGGDGFGEVMSASLGAKTRTAQACDAAHRACAVQWWWEPKRKIAVIESARVIGLAMLPPKQFHPFELDTFGLGLVLRAAAEQGARRCLVGIGGSATNDGGFGLARALGWQFLDRRGKAIERWTELRGLARIRAPRRRRWFRDLVVAVDVRNPLLGPHGATRIYGPQKGLRRQQFAVAERCLRRLVQVVRNELGLDLAEVPGAGAAGGLGFGLPAFAGARLEAGFDMFARELELERRLRSTDLVLTGEGEMDKSTFMGKGVGQVAQRCYELGIPCFGLAGVVTARPSCFTGIHSLLELTSLERAKAKPGLWLERLAKQVAGQLAG